MSYEIREEKDGTVIEVAGEPTPEKLRALCAPFGSLGGLDYDELLGLMLDAFEGYFDALGDIAALLAANDEDHAVVEWTPGRVSLITPTSSSRISLVHGLRGGVQLGILLPATGAAFDATRAHDTSSGALTLLSELVALGQDPHVDGQPDLWAWSVVDRASRLVEALRTTDRARREMIECGLILAELPEDHDEADAQGALGTRGFCMHHRRRYDGCGCEPMRPCREPGAPECECCGSEADAGQSDYKLCMACYTRTGCAVCGSEEEES